MSPMDTDNTTDNASDNTYEHHDPDATANTRRAYGNCWNKYLRWCAEAQREPWNDPDGSTFAAFVAAQVRAGAKRSTIRLHRAAVSYRYRTDPALYGADDPTRTEAVRVEMGRMAKRTRAQRQKKALPMTPDVLEKVLIVSAQPRRTETPEAAMLRHLEAEATLRLMFDCALRTDDMTRVEWAHIDTDPAANGHRTCYVAPGKTGHGRHGNVSAPTWAALQRWRAATPDRDRYVSTTRSAHSLAQRIARLGQYADIPISGHSPRRGVLTAAARNGASVFELMAVSGHRSPEMVAEYVDAPDAAANVVTKLYEPADTSDDGGIDAMVSRVDADLTIYTEQWIVLEISEIRAALDMAVKLGADRDHPAVVAAHDRLAELWPNTQPPQPCARPDCPGLVNWALGSADQRWCSRRCSRATG